MTPKCLCLGKKAVSFLLMSGIISILSTAMQKDGGNAYGSDKAGITLSGTEDKTGPQLQSLIARLHDSDSYERQRAAITLGTLGDKAAVEPLIQAMKDEDEFVRDFAVRSLERLGDSRAVEPLIQAMKDESLLVRRSAIEVLGHLGDSKAVAPLVEAAKDGNNIVRRSAIEALGRIGGLGEINVIMEALRDEDSYIRDGAAIALADIGKAAVPAMVQSLPDWTAGPGAAQTLKNLNWQPSSDEERIWFDVSLRNRQSLLDNWPVARQVLLRDAAGNDARRIQNAVFALICLGQDALTDRLLEILKDKGNIEIAEAFLSSGNAVLSEAAHEWAQNTGAAVEADNYNPVVEWGKM